MFKIAQNVEQKLDANNNIWYYISKKKGNKHYV